MKRLMLMLFPDVVQDMRPKLNGWAPGGYINKCFNCDNEFIGDKRAVECALCAYDATNKGVSDEATNSRRNTRVHARA